MDLVTVGGCDGQEDPRRRCTRDRSKGIDKVFALLHTVSHHHHSYLCAFHLSCFRIALDFMMKSAVEDVLNVESDAPSSSCRS